MHSCFIIWTFFDLHLGVDWVKLASTLFQTNCNVIACLRRKQCFVQFQECFYQLRAFVLNCVDYIFFQIAVCVLWELCHLNKAFIKKTSEKGVFIDKNTDQVQPAMLVWTFGKSFVDVLIAFVLMGEN